MTKEDFKVNVTDDNYLVLTVEKKNECKDEDKKKKYLRREFSYHKFEQSFALPKLISLEKVKMALCSLYGIKRVTGHLFLFNIWLH